MPLIQLVIVLVVVGLILWVINSYIPMQSTIKSILNVVVVNLPESGQESPSRTSTKRE
jgi:hypothetical protein